MERHLEIQEIKNRTDMTIEKQAKTCALDEVKPLEFSDTNPTPTRFKSFKRKAG